MRQDKAVVSLIITTVLSLLPVLSYAGGESGLVGKMSKLQYFTHKTGLALQNENTRLASFYVHEIEETIEDLETFGQYKSYDIGKLVENVLVPEFKELEKQVKHGKPAAQWKAYNAVIKSCNSCHQTTAHEYIRIEFNNENPYLQSFGR
jgi:hypothetical protein